MNFRFEFAPKDLIDLFLPKLFDILYGNMHEIAPTGNTRDSDYEGWFSEVSPAMQKDPRQIVLMYDGDEIAGYFQYYTTADKLMMEEIQLKKEYHGSGLFGEFYAWLVRQLPQDLETVEAYSHENNVKSQGILGHLGLKRLEFNNNYSAYHYKGRYEDILKKYLK